MHTTDDLLATIRRLEAENERLRREASWATLRLRECMETARRALGDLEAQLLDAPSGA